MIILVGELHPAQLEYRLDLKIKRAKGPDTRIRIPLMNTGAKLFKNFSILFGHHFTKNPSFPYQ
jgi:hypothetical protein